MRFDLGRVSLELSKLDLQDALDMAVLIEQEAHDRYVQFADQLGVRYSGDAGSVFETMAANEAKHRDQLIAKRHSLFGQAPSRLNQDFVDEVEAPGFDKPRAFMSARHALQVALECEVKAQAFFDHALTMVSDKDVKELFTELRDEEIEHQRFLDEALARVSTEMTPDVDPEDVEIPPGL